MHISVPTSNTMEIIEQTEVSPLISKAVVKVCYVGQEPNRNGTVITKELATEMGKKLPGSPIVGNFDKSTNDFGGHDKQIIVQGGKVDFVELTRPYGFIPTDATIWFQTFSDDGIEHEYLCAECLIWTGAYPESKRILEEGNNQSMELSNESGYWAEDFSHGSFFIYNEALIEKLCVLGQNVEPCFEGAQIKSQFSLEFSQELKEFETKMYSMLNQLLDKGGSQVDEFKKNNPEEEGQDPNKENPKQEDPKQEEKKEKKPSNENTCGGGSGGSDSDKEKKEEPEEKKDDEKNKKYNLEDVVEYTELNGKYTELQSKYDALQAEHATLTEEVTQLREFKLNADRKDKQTMIDSFFMLSDEDKKEVIEHMDTYSVDDIEAKLSVICVRNKVSFNLEQENHQEEKKEVPTGLFSLGISDDDNAPAWIKAVRETAKN